MKPRILIFIDWFLPGYQAGGPVRSIANLIGHLGDAAAFYIITRNTDYTETKPYEGIEANKWTRYSDNTSVYYFSQDQLSAKSVKQVAENANCELWYITGIYSLLFSILPARIKTKAAKIIAPRGMLSAHAIDVKSVKKKLFLSLAKLVKQYQGITFHATNEAEAEDIKMQFPGSKISIVPNLPIAQSSNNTNKLIKKENELKLCSVARIAEEKNTLGAIRILKALGSESFAADIHITYDLYGHMYDKEYWEKCLEEIGSLPNTIKVTHHGSISPEQIPDKILASHFLFLPTHGENFGHAIQESFALGRPVIISDRTPWRDLEKHEAGWDLPLDQTDQFTGVLQHCLKMDQEAFNKMSVSSRQYYINTAAIEESIAKYKTLFSNEAKRSKTG